MDFQTPKSRSIRVRRGVPQKSNLGPVLIYFIINDLPSSLPSSVSCFHYADDLAIWSSSPSVPAAVETTQGALICWSAGLGAGVFLSIRANLWHLSSQWIPNRLTYSHTFFYSTLPSASTHSHLPWDLLRMYFFLF